MPAQGSSPLRFVKVTDKSEAVRQGSRSGARRAKTPGVTKREPRETNVVVATPEELRELLSEALSEALERHASVGPPPPELVKGEELARLLSVSRTTVHRLRQEGMPAIRMGETFRYHLGDCVEWLRRRDG